MAFIDYLTEADVARIIVVGVLWRDLQGQVAALDKQRGDAVRAQLQLLVRKAEADARLQALDNPPPPPGPLSPTPPAAKGAAKGAAATGFTPRSARLLDPAALETMKSGQREAAAMAARLADGAAETGERRIEGLGRKRDQLLADGLDSAVFRKRRSIEEHALLPKVITYWPHLSRALKGGFNAKSAMQDDPRLLGNALGTLAAEVGVLFEPVSERQSYGTAQGFGFAKQKYGSTGRDLRPFGNYDGRLGNAPFQPRYNPELAMSIDDQFLIQDLESDGRKFRGRGFVQMTGRAKYAKAAAHLAETFKDCDLIADPDLANDARMASEIFADELKSLEPHILTALKKGDLIAARSWVNAGNGNNRNPNGAQEYAAALRATLIVLMEKIERKELAPEDAKRLLAACEETDQAMRAAEAKAARGP
ncbi:MAG: hypothetical protein IT556_19000 [Acetobacteraceae bacterium]|nr:hypothetical protein [Acetobacteraceae bacterium]